MHPKVMVYLVVCLVSLLIFRLIDRLLKPTLIAGTEREEDHTGCDYGGRAIDLLSSEGVDGAVVLAAITGIGLGAIYWGVHGLRIRHQGSGLEPSQDRSTGAYLCSEDEFSATNRGVGSSQGN